MTRARSRVPRYFCLRARERVTAACAWGKPRAVPMHDDGHHPRRTPLLLVGLVLAWSAWLLCCAPAAVRAWCRASDEVGAHGECVPQPRVPFLFWTRSCVAYAFNERVFDALDPLTEHEVRAAFRAAFDAWAAVDCGGKRPFFVEQLAQTTATSQSEFLRDGGNEMVILALSAARWRGLGDHASSAIALTLMWHNRRTGEILDSDMELNLGAGRFDDCVAHRCRAGTIDLQNAITHEAGHVLGLGHSVDQASTMAAHARGGVDTQKRSLEPDDMEGYCALDLPEWRCRGPGCACPPPPVIAAYAGLPSSSRAGCQVSCPGGLATGSGWVVSALAGLQLASRRRTRSKRRREVALD